METFKINDNYKIICSTTRGGGGFRHIAKLVYNNNIQTTSTVQYYNRTWERFTYETVLKKLLKKVSILTEEEQMAFIENLRDNDLEEINRQFSFISGIAKLGDILCHNQKDKNDWKTRMLKAGLENKGLIMPDDWDTLSEDDKENRLNGVINHLGN